MQKKTIVLNTCNDDAGIGRRKQQKLVYRIFTCKFSISGIWTCNINFVAKSLYATQIRYPLMHIWLQRKSYPCSRLYIAQAKQPEMLRKSDNQTANINVKNYRFKHL